MTEDSQRQTAVVFFIGPRKIAALQGALDEGEPRILKYVIQNNPEGFDRGFVTHLERASASLDVLAKSLLPGESTETISPFVVLDNSKLRTYGFSSSQYFQGFQRTISSQEVRSVVNQTRSVATLPLSEFVLQAFPESFLVNDLSGIRNPLGLEAQRLGVQLKIHTMNFQDFKNISRTFEAAELEAAGYFPSTLALSEGVLTTAEKEEGVLLIDIEDDRIHLILWKAGCLLATHTLEIRNHALNSQIASAWGIEVGDADKVRERYGSLEINPVFGEELIPLVERNGNGNLQIQRREFHAKFLEQAEKWMKEILSASDVFIAEHRVLYPHLVFTGSGTSMDGFLEFMQKKISRNARIGLAKKVEAPNEICVDPSMAAPLGIFRWLSNQMREHKQFFAPQGFLQKTLASTKDWFSAYF